MTKSIPISKSEAQDAIQCEYDKDIKVLQLATRIVIGRFQNHLLCPNNLAEQRGWETWRDHAKVLVSFTVYCATVDAYIHKRYGKCGFETLHECRQ